MKSICSKSNYFCLIYYKIDKQSKFATNEGRKTSATSNSTDSIGKDSSNNAKNDNNKEKDNVNNSNTSGAIDDLSDRLKQKS